MRFHRTPHWVALGPKSQLLHDSVRVLFSNSDEQKRTKCSRIFPIHILLSLNRTQVKSLCERLTSLAREGGSSIGYDLRHEFNDAKYSNT